jgi:uncharacterized protein (DUF927 family)
MNKMTRPRLTEMVTPVPANAPSLPEHDKLGKHTRSWAYHNAEGQILAHVLRFDLPPKKPGGKADKAILPLTLWRTEEGGLKWDWKNQPAPRALYRLNHLVDSAQTDKVILITEGEKAADAAAKLFPEMVTTTPMNGANAPAMTDWSVCAGRHCVIATDLDEPGEKFANKVAELLSDVGAASIRRLDLKQLAVVFWRDGAEMLRPEHEIISGYDLADSLADGWTAPCLKAFLEKNPAVFTQITGPASDTADAETTEEGVSAGVPGWSFVSDENGVWKREEKFNNELKIYETVTHFVCAPLEIIGFARDANGDDWGRVVELTNPDGQVRRILMPSRDFAGQATDAIKRLLSAGLLFQSNRLGKERLLEYLLGSLPSRRLTHTRKPGWVSNSFCLPDISFGPEDVLCDLGSSAHLYKVRGTLTAWQEMAALAIGNSRLAFALSAAFVGPLLHPLGQEGGGIHFVGSMGSGKSTVAKVAGSVWGGNGRQTYALSWSGSDSGHEAIASRANDTLLILDEIGRADPTLLGMIIYQSMNGTGKNRADVDSNLKEVIVFKIMVISTGEITVSEAISASPRGGRVMAGQLVRLLDIPADVDEKLGVFENLHGFETSRAFATHLESVFVQNHGHAARAYLTQLTADLPAAVDAVKGAIDAFLAQVCPPQASRQVQRAAARFALIAAAGELAAAFGVLPWPEGEAVRAAQSCFDAWLATQSALVMPREKIDAIAAVQRFISLHGPSRFVDLDHDPTINPYPRIITNRAGYSRMTEAGEEYCILPEVWRSEVCTGRNAEQIARYLAESGLLVTGEPGRFTKKMRVPDQPKAIRCYVVTPDILSWADTGTADEGDEEPLK